MHQSVQSSNHNLFTIITIQISLLAKIGKWSWGTWSHAHSTLQKVHWNSTCEM